MRLLILASSFHPVIGGAETYAYVIAEGMAARGHDVTLVTDSPPGWSPTPMPGDPAGVNVRRLWRYRELLADPSKVPWEQLHYSLLPEIDEVVSEVRPEVVFTNTLEGAMVGRLVSLDRGIPWAATFHEHEPEALPLGTARLRLVHEVLRPALVLACAKNYAERARRHGSAALEIIHHGIDTEVFRPDRDTTELRQRLGLHHDNLVIVCAGQIKPRKGMRELVAAFAQVSDDLPQAILLIVGRISSSSGNYPLLLADDIDRLGLVDRVRVRTDVDFPDMPDVMALADIVAQPSASEGLSLAMLEAMASERPLVAYDFPGITELVDNPDAAVVVDSVDPAGLVNALRRLAADAGLRRRIGARARRHVLTHFSRERMVAQTERALSNLLAHDADPR